jgi:hypothetical protein
MLSWLRKQLASTNVSCDRPSLIDVNLPVAARLK